MATHRLQTNIPVTGRVKYLNDRPSRGEVTAPDGTTFTSAHQVCLKGTWDGIGDADIYLPGFLAEHMIRDGLAQDAGVRDGKQQFKWVYNGRVQVLRAEEGRTKRTSVLPLDAPPVVGGRAAPTAAGAESPPPAAGTGQARQTPGTTAAAPASVPLSTQDSEPWKALARQYRKAVDIARWAWNEDRELGNIGPDDVVAAAATVFIEANKRGLTVPAPVEKLTPEQKAAVIRDAVDRYAEPPKALVQGEDDDDLPF